METAHLSHDFNELDAKYETTGGAARALNKSENTVRRLADRGDLVSIRTASGLRLFPRHELTRFLETKRKAGSR